VQKTATKEMDKQYINIMTTAIESEVDMVSIEKLINPVNTFDIKNNKIPL